MGRWELMGLWISIIVSTLFIAMFIRRYIYFVTLVSFSSMSPTVKSGDRILTTRIYNFNNVSRGDILVLYSQELQVMMVKRVIGLPDDLVEMKEHGSIYINRVKFDEPYVENHIGLNQTFKVPAQKYFFLGDNRVLSNDSRSWLEPFILEKDIRGKARFCLFPLNRLTKFK